MDTGGNLISFHIIFWFWAAFYDTTRDCDSLDNFTAVKQMWGSISSRAAYFVFSKWQVLDQKSLPNIF